MKKSSKFLLVMLMTVMCFTGVYAVTAQPGTEDDPLVSKSYVDAQIASVKSAGGSNFAVVYVEAGQKVIGGEGTEIIVRSGEATIVENSPNGVANLNTGEDMKNGQDVRLDHLLLIPRADGRVILAGTEGNLMVRGSYTIE